MDVDRAGPVLLALGAPFRRHVSRHRLSHPRHSLNLTNPVQREAGRQGRLLLPESRNDAVRLALVSCLIFYGYLPIASIIFKV